MASAVELLPLSLPCCVKPPRAGSHTDQEWEDIKPHLMKWYREENKTLRETMRLLEANLSFYATNKQYKTRLARWKIGKYNRDRECLHLIRKAQHFEKSSERVSFHIRGRQTTVEDAKRHLARKLQLSSDNITKRLPRSPTPSVLSVREIRNLLPADHFSLPEDDLTRVCGAPGSSITATNNEGQFFFDESDPSWKLEWDHPTWLEYDVPAWLDDALMPPWVPADTLVAPTIDDQTPASAQVPDGLLFTAVEMPPPPKRRSKHGVTRRRTKTGCLTCRMRRVKCDEARPTCRNCEKSRRLCAGHQAVMTTTSSVVKQEKSYNHNVLTLSSCGPQNDWMFLRAALPLPQRLNTPCTLQVHRMELALFILQRIIQLYFATDMEEIPWIFGFHTNPPPALKAILIVVRLLAASIEKRCLKHDWESLPKLYYPSLI